jgi:NADH-quinone oxidoreductase subunit N
VNFHQLVQNAIADTLGPSLTAFRPELALCATILVLLLVRMLGPIGKLHPFYVALVGSLVALCYAAPWHLTQDGALVPAQIFTGMLVYDPFAVYMRTIILAFLVLFAVLTWITGVPQREDATDFFVLVFGAALGMCLMASANHMLVVFLAIEMASVPSYALAGMLKDRRASSEAALKYAIYGAGTAGVMLYGISLLCGVLGSPHLPTMATKLAELIQSGGGDRVMLLVLGGLMIMVGVAFKLSAVPFHFWAPDVFEGASAEVAAFLSVASKAAALAVLVRVALGLTTAAEPAAMAALEPARQYGGGLIALLAAITCTFGNLAAYGQSNMKRLLAYSTIAHAGYMMMAVAAAVMLAGKEPYAAQKAISALGFYVGAYLFMNLGAFACVAFLRNASGSEEIASYTGLIRRSTGLALCLAVILFSLIGLPPLAGFAGKFSIFVSLATSDPRLLTLLVIGGLNTVLSVFYYLRVVKVMTLPADTVEASIPRVPFVSLPGLYCLAVTVPVIVLGIWWNPLLAWTTAAAAKLVAM